MQRLFSAFPEGRAGAGLLLLRIAVGLSLLAQVAGQLVNPEHPTAAVWIGDTCMIVSAIAIIVGFLTPVPAAVLTCLIAGRWAVRRICGVVDGDLTALLLAANTVAIALLGPGAFSIDGHLFGRREVIIPPQSLDHD